jgi:hypothetical protein
LSPDPQEAFETVSGTGPSSELPLPPQPAMTVTVASAHATNA